MNKIYILALMLSTTLANSQAVEGKLLSRWNDQSLPSSTAHDNRYNEVWGVVQDDVEYAIIGTTWGTHFIDISDPSNATEVMMRITKNSFYTKFVSHPSNGYHLPSSEA